MPIDSGGDLLIQVGQRIVRLRPDEGGVMQIEQCNNLPVPENFPDLDIVFGGCGDIAAFHFKWVHEYEEPEMG